MASDDEEGTKGNRKRVPIWTIVKNASFAITACFFILLIVLSLDAYKFISVRVSWLAFTFCHLTLEYPIFDESLIPCPICALNCLTPPSSLEKINVLISYPSKQNSRAKSS